MNYRIVLKEAPGGQPGRRFFELVGRTLGLTDRALDRRRTGRTIWVADTPELSTAEAIREAIVTGYGYDAVIVPTISGPDRRVRRLVPALKKATAGTPAPRAPTPPSKPALAAPVEVAEGTLRPRIPAASTAWTGPAHTIGFFVKSAQTPAPRPTAHQPHPPPATGQFAMALHAIVDVSISSRGEAPKLITEDYPPTGPMPWMAGPAAVEHPPAPPSAPGPSADEAPEADDFWATCEDEVGLFDGAPDLDLEVVAPHDARYDTRALNPLGKAAAAAVAEAQDEPEKPALAGRLAAAASAAWHRITG
ncbi:MAG: hypothetical protein H6704_23190 [Myxococcales bacterium]|nr:hypothetical protein [Myxococcales bacterium]